MCIGVKQNFSEEVTGGDERHREVKGSARRLAIGRSLMILLEWLPC